MRIRWFLLFVAYLSLAIHAFLDISRGPLFPSIITDLQVTTKEGSLFFSATSLCMFLSTFSSQRLLARLSVGMGLSFYMGLMILGQYLLFRAHSTWELLAAGSFLGLGFGGMGVCQNLAISEAAPVSMHRRLFAGLHSMYAFAALCAPLLVSTYLEGGGTWRQFSFYALMVPLLAIFCFLAGAKKLNFKTESAESLQSVAKLPLKTKLFSSLGLSLYVTAELIVSIWLVIFLQREKNFSVGLAGDALSLFFFFLLAGRLLIGFVSLPLSNYKLLQISFVGSAICLLIGLVISPWGLALSGLFMSVSFPSYMSYMAENYKENLKEIIPYCIGGMSLFIMAAHSFAGYLGEITSLTHSLSLALFSMLAGVLALWFFEHKILRKA